MNIPGPLRYDYRFPLRINSSQRQAERSGYADHVAQMIREFLIDLSFFCQILARQGRSAALIRGSEGGHTTTTNSENHRHLILIPNRWTSGWSVSLSCEWQ